MVLLSTLVFTQLAEATNYAYMVNVNDDNR